MSSLRALHIGSLARSLGPCCRSGPATVKPPLDAGRELSRQSGPMSSAEVDRYLADLPEPKRSTLEDLRQAIAEVVPAAEEGISYGVPAFRLQGKVVAGFAAFKNHLSYLPHSGSVFAVLKEELAQYEFTSGSLHFSIDSPLPRSLVERLVSVRITQAFPAR